MRTRKWILIAAAAAVLVALAALLLDRGIAVAARRLIAAATGFDTTIGSLDARLLKQSFEVRDLRIRNPPDFPDREAFDLKRLYVQYDLASFFGPTTRLREVSIEIPRVVMVRKADGESNLERMRKNRGERKDEPAGRRAGGAGRKEPPPGSGSPREKPESKAKPGKAFMIDTLHVSIGELEIRDYTRMKDGRPAVTLQPIHFEQTLRQVDGVQAIMGQVAAAVLIESGAKAAVEKLADPETQKELGEELNKAARKLNKAFESLFRKQQGAAP